MSNLLRISRRGCYKAKPHLTQPLRLAPMAPIKYDIPQTATVFFSLAAVTLVILGMGLLIVRPLFYKMASTPFEYLKKSVKPKKNRTKTKVFSSIYTHSRVGQGASRPLQYPPLYPPRGQAVIRTLRLYGCGSAWR